ncbi:MAG: phage portal protein, partial [Candidatus Limnocylindrales bacterium]
MLHDLIWGPDIGPIVRASPPPAPAPRAPEALGHGLPVNLGTFIEDAVNARLAGFALADALRMPSVIRAVQLLAGTLAQMAPLAYRDEVLLELQPRILRRPSPFGSRYEFVYQTVYALLAGDENAAKAGNAWWMVTSRDSEELPTAVILLPGSEVRVEWDEKRFVPRTHWRGQLVPARDIIHIALGRRPGGLLGRSPIEDGLDALAVGDTAERFAASWFLSSGIPSVTLKVPGAMDAVEADKLKRQWMAAHAGPEPTPAVLTGGVELDVPDMDPQRSQLQEARDYTNTITARLLGIPAPMLHVSTSGATITYVGAAGAMEELVKTTVAPIYMPPLEAAFGELLPRTQSAR